MWTRPITVAGTAVFIRQAADLWTDEERADFVNFIARNPEAGDLIPGAGGLRKVRWNRKGTGKRGGVRVIYFFHNPEMPIYLPMLYAKSQRDDLSPDAKRSVQALVARLSWHG